MAIIFFWRDSCFWDFPPFDNWRKCDNSCCLCFCATKGNTHPNNRMAVSITKTPSGRGRGEGFVCRGMTKETKILSRKNIHNYSTLYTLFRVKMSDQRLKQPAYLRRCSKGPIYTMSTGGIKDCAVDQFCELFRDLPTS